MENGPTPFPHALAQMGFGNEKPPRFNSNNSCTFPNESTERVVLLVSSLVDFTSTLGVFHNTTSPQISLDLGLVCTFLTSSIRVE